MNISDLQQKYVEVKSLRRSGWISKILLNKKFKWKLSPFQPIRVYVKIAQIDQFTNIARNSLSFSYDEL